MGGEVLGIRRPHRWQETRVLNPRRGTKDKKYPRRDTKELISRAPALPCGLLEEKRPTVNKEEPRMDTNNTQIDFLQDNQNASAILCPWCDSHGMMASWERGRPARTKLGTASPISPTWINRERRHGFLRPGRCCSRRQGGCLQHRTEAQRQRDSMRAGRPRSQAMPSRLCRAD